MVAQKLYVFIEFNNLTKIDLKSLNKKACRKVYILINESIDQLPLSLTKKILFLGSRVKFISIPDYRETDYSLHLSLMVGTLHQKVIKSIQFAIISDNPAFHSVAAKLKQSNRKVIVLGLDQSISTEEKSITKINTPLEESAQLDIPGNRSSNSTAVVSRINAHVENITSLAVDETIKAFNRTDKWPSTVEKLRYFISLYVEEYAKHVNMDDIIDRLVEIGKIKVNDLDEVVYFRRRA